MTHGSLFSGIAGFDLAAQWMGWENIFNFIDIPKKMNVQPLELPVNDIQIDFTHITDTSMDADLIKATHSFIIAYGWLLLKKRENEKQGH